LVYYLAAGPAPYTILVEFKIQLDVRFEVNECRFADKLAPYAAHRYGTNTTIRLCESDQVGGSDELVKPLGQDTMQGQVDKCGEGFEVCMCATFTHVVQVVET
jgi:hypothetical protein